MGVNHRLTGAARLWCSSLESPHSLLTLPFGSQVTFGDWSWRQRSRVGVECTVNFLSLCISWNESSVYQHRGAATREETFFTFNLSFSATRPFTSTHPLWIRTRLDWTRQEWAAHWPVLGRAVSLRDSLTVSSLWDTPLHMLTSILPGTDAGRCGGHPFTSARSTTERMKPHSLFSGLSF